MISRRRFLASPAAAALLPSAARAARPPMPIFDAHIHFSHDAAARFSAGEAVAIPERAGLKRVPWAHAGSVDPDIVGPMLGKHDDWRSLFAAFPDRVMVGTDTFTPERWHHVVEHADWTRRWLADLPPDLAEKIAWRNGEAMLRPHFAQLR